MRYAIYDIPTGSIYSVKFTSPFNEEFVRSKLPQNAALWVGDCPPEATHIINNEPVTIIPEPIPIPPPTPAEIAKRLTDTAQRHLDSVARSRNYDGILSLCSYANSTDLTFKTEAEAGIMWRDSVWRFMYGLQTELTAGTLPVPTDAELIAMLPVILWPVRPN